jgi:hypothetical protein
MFSSAHIESNRDRELVRLLKLISLGHSTRARPVAALVTCLSRKLFLLFVPWEATGEAAASCLFVPA